MPTYQKGTIGVLSETCLICWWIPIFGTYYFISERRLIFVSMETLPCIYRPETDTSGDGNIECISFHATPNAFQFYSAYPEFQGSLLPSDGDKIGRVSWFVDSCSCCGVRLRKPGRLPLWYFSTKTPGCSRAFVSPGFGLDSSSVMATDHLLLETIVKEITQFGYTTEGQAADRVATSGYYTV